MKRNIIPILTLVSLLYACEGSEVELEVKEDVEAVEKPSKPVEKEVEKEAEKKTVTVEEILAVYKATLVGNFDVTYNEERKAFMFYPVNESFNKDLADIMKGYLPKDMWEKTAESFRTMTIATEEQLGSGYIHAMMNPYNRDNIILLVQDGTIKLDALEDVE